MPDQISEQGDEGNLQGVWNHQRTFFAGIVNGKRQPESSISDNPEATYDTLEKYGYDMVERARNQKLDPVIGRDAEIRNVVRILSTKDKE